MEEMPENDDGIYRQGSLKLAIRNENSGMSILKIKKEIESHSRVLTHTANHE